MRGFNIKIHCDTFEEYQAGNANYISFLVLLCPCTRKIVLFDLGLSPADAVQLGIGLIAIWVLLGAFKLLANLTAAAPPTAAHPTTALIIDPPRTTQ
jgi:hypothetical protein